MPRYVIERSIPGAGKLSPADLHAIAARSNAVIRELGAEIQWLHSYVTADKIYCVYVAKSAELIREHARRGGFPADSVSEATASIDATTGEAAP